MLVSLSTMPSFTEITPKTGLAPAEISQRVALLKRFKELLKAQRDRFRTYLDSLDRQKDIIEGGTADDLINHVELEEKIISDIFSIQKVIDPLEKMYHTVKPELTVSEGNEVSGIKQALEGLKSEAVIRSGRNKELLSKRMTEIRSEIKTLRNNPYTRRRIDSAAAAPSRIDIKG